MSEVFDKLKSLQDILSEKYEIENSIKESPKELEAQETLLARQKKEYLEKNAVYEECKEKVAALTAELQDAVKLREEGEKGMDNISTHREYEALDKQITEATAKEEAVRKDLDKEKKRCSELSEDLKMDEGYIKDSENDLNGRKASINKQLDKYKKQLDKLSKKEESVSEGLDQEVVYKFQRIIQRNSKGIVAVKGTVCDGCHMILPAQFANEVREGEKILFCPYCSRILYYEQAQEGEVDFFLVDPDELQFEETEEETKHYEEEMDRYASDSESYDEDRESYSEDNKRFSDDGDYSDKEKDDEDDDEDSEDDEEEQDIVEEE
ncbi:MAG: C4-type zinc ribbon domain-containing protein [Treponema sp.]|nr:C4-type zinc ribbon domain-containing protein [Treponema sp.]